MDLDQLRAEAERDVVMYSTDFLLVLDALTQAREELADTEFEIGALRDDLETERCRGDGWRAKYDADTDFRNEARELLTVALADLETERLIHGCANKTPVVDKRVKRARSWLASAPVDTQEA